MSNGNFHNDFLLLLTMNWVWILMAFLLDDIENRMVLTATKTIVLHRRNFYIDLNMVHLRSGRRSTVLRDRNDQFSSLVVFCCVCVWVCVWTNVWLAIHIEIDFTINGKMITKRSKQQQLQSYGHVRSYTRWQDGSAEKSRRAVDRNDIEH